MRAKKDDNLDSWRTQYPSTTVSWRINGDDHALAQHFIGEAKSMLYGLKNRMRISVPKLSQLQDIRQFDDGSSIIVKSVFGQDFIEITPGISGKIPTCSITLFNVPETVQPMRWYSDGIHEGEIEGIDYIKTYYSISRSNCDQCSEQWSICNTVQLNADIGLTSEKKCLPFIFLDDRKSAFGILPTREDIKNSHCIYSLSGCQAEVIEKGSDKHGDFFIWKTYTEWSNLGPTEVTFSQNGLGYMLMQIAINDPNGKKVCSGKEIVKVDCCLKPEVNRGLVMYWDRYCGINPDCPVPSPFPYDVLTFFLPRTFWVKPELGACIPFEWELNGSGMLTVGGDYNQFASYMPPEGGVGACNNGIVLKVRDRCGTTYTVQSTKCCDNPSSLAIGYTSLLMSCSQSQELTANGGCGQYQWSISGGGTLTPNPNNSRYATYMAPASNPNCANNATITLTDCCGQSSQIQIVINCYSGNDTALSTYVKTFCIACYDPGWPFRYFKMDYVYNGYRCDGIQNCNEHIPCGDLLNCRIDMDPGCANCLVGGISPCGGTVPINSISGIIDVRTELMKTQGCCPLNPWTGLPY